MPPQNENTGRRHYVAVVDDDTSVRRALKRLLDSAGFTVETYALGDDFLASMDANHVPDCLVLDIFMPHLSGIDVQSIVAASGLRVPVIFITAHDDPNLRAQAFAVGASAYFQKPVTEEALLKAIHAALEGGV